MKPNGGFHHISLLIFLGIGITLMLVALVFAKPLVYKIQNCTTPATQEELNNELDLGVIKVGRGYDLQQAPKVPQISFFLNRNHIPVGQMYMHYLPLNLKAYNTSIQDFGLHSPIQFYPNSAGLVEVNDSMSSATFAFVCNDKVGALSLCKFTRCQELNAVTKFLASKKELKINDSLASWVHQEKKIYNSDPTEKRNPSPDSKKVCIVNTAHIASTVSVQDENGKVKEVGYGHLCNWNWESDKILFLGQATDISSIHIYMYDLKTETLVNLTENYLDGAGFVYFSNARWNQDGSIVADYEYHLDYSFVNPDYGRVLIDSTTWSILEVK